ncbi:MAG: deoxyribodipyrimidine photolyase [Deltaproteobacteria bacterium]|nr:deoxyribodipyrimidine photolyase [Deltaproteobacteria bacterium]
MVPAARVRALNEAPAWSDGDYVLHWMTATRRVRSSFALDRSLEHARALGKPLVILEALRVGYRWASDRLHRFILDGMAENQRRLDAAPVTYFPYVEEAPDAGKGLLAALAARACLIVTDDFPCFMLPHMAAAAARQVNVRMEAVDGNGLLPMRAASQVFPTAYAFRRFLQKTLPEHLPERPALDPWSAGAPLARLAALPREITTRWPVASPELLSGGARELARLPIDHAVSPVPVRGGSAAGEEAARRFVARRLGDYGEHRNEPESEVTSGLSPYLHFGHVSPHDVFDAIVARERWSPDRTAERANGSREGWWGMSAAAEGFLDQLVTWRELGYNFCWQRDDHDRYESLPAWARKTLDEHTADPRPHAYALDDLEHARTHDPLWNAAQTQLVREGTIHNYLRMLWGKKILEWSPTPREALAVMIELNNKYALDGRNPNSYSGIFWTLGRYDRPWAPERPIFGTIRYMSSQNTARKVRVKEYLARYAPEVRQQRLL